MTVSAFDVAIGEARESGFMLARLETLRLAITDNRLDRTCLKVLAVMVEAMNEQTFTTFLGRQKISQKLGITEKSVTNYWCILRRHGYIHSKRMATPQAKNRVLMHHTLSRLDPAELEAEVLKLAKRIRGDEFPQERALPAMTGTQKPINTGLLKGVPAMTGSHTANPLESARNDGTESARNDGRSNSSKSNTRSSYEDQRHHDDHEDLLGDEVAQVEVFKTLCRWRDPESGAIRRIKFGSVANWFPDFDQETLSRFVTMEIERAVSDGKTGDLFGWIRSRIQADFKTYQATVTGTAVADAKMPAAQRLPCRGIGGRR